MLLANNTRVKEHVNMERELKNKVVVITGGAQGIGYQIADSCLQKGATVAILDINETVGAEAAKNLTSKYGRDKTEFFKCDVTTDLDAVYKMLVHKYKTVDVLVNNAGVIDETSIKRVVGINAIAVMEWTMKFWEHMRIDKGGKGGTIINMASMYGFLEDPFLPYYKATKYAVLGFTKTLGHELNYRKYGVRVLAICPGFTDTKLLALPPAPDMVMKEEFMKFMERTPWQSTEAVAEATVSVFESADSGTAWFIENGNDVVKVPAVVEYPYEL